MREDGPRLNKLKLVYKKAIQEILKEEKKIKEVLDDPNVSAEDSFFANPKTNEADQKESLSKGVESKDQTIEGIFSTLRSRLSELFKGKLAVNSVEDKLNLLDKDISENRISLRDVSSEEYVREVFESHLVEPKLEYIDYIEEAKRRSLDRIDMLKKELEEVSKELSLLKEENRACDSVYNKLVNTFLEAVENKRNS